MKIIHCLLHTPSTSFLPGVICKNMNRLCWVFVLLAVVAVPSYARDNRPMDCQEWQAAGNFTSGVYTVWLGGNPVRVRCDMDTDGGGWTVIQRRGNSSHPQTFDFFWKDYKNGIGRVENDFWLGNDNIFALTNQGNYSLRMDMKSAYRESAFAVFEEFRIKDEKTNYTMHVYGYSGTAGTSMQDGAGMMFSTRDRNNGVFTTNCAEGGAGGFWYSGCAECHPNGLYLPGIDDETSDATMSYYSFKKREGLLSIDMKIRRR